MKSEMGWGGMKVGKGKFTSYRLAQRSEKPWVDHFHSASPPPQFSCVRFEEARGRSMGRAGCQRQHNHWPVSGQEESSRMMALLSTCAWVLSS